MTHLLEKETVLVFHVLNPLDPFGDTGLLEPIPGNVRRRRGIPSPVASLSQSNTTTHTQSHQGVT